MLAPLLHSLLFAQAAATPAPLEQVQLEQCLDKARGDPATAMAEASSWLGETSGAPSSYPQQCLGYAYTLLLRWDAAEHAFLAAREAELETSHFRRAQLATMAANAALAENRGEAALPALGLAATDAALSGDAGLRAVVETDRARALVQQGREGEAEAVLAAARSFDGQNALAWLLSATLSRRMGDLVAAQAQIVRAAELDPRSRAVGLEAGVIAVLAGQDEAARKSWQSVVEASPESAEAEIARGYLAQLDGATSGS